MQYIYTYVQSAWPRKFTIIGKWHANTNKYKRIAYEINIKVTTASATTYEYAKYVINLKWEVYLKCKHLPLATDSQEPLNISQNTVARTVQNEVVFPPMMDAI